MARPQIRRVGRNRPLPCRKARPAVILLEERRLLAAFLVNATYDAVDVDPGDGIAADAQGNTTLRAAVMEANALTGEDAITLPSGTFSFSLRGPGEDAATTGDLDVTDSLMIT